MAFMPATDAPPTEWIEASSSSIWIATPPTSGKRFAIVSEISEAGVIG